MIIWLTAIILGLVEGITEFLPVSSTGHLIVAQRILNFKDVKDVFTVVIQLGAIAAVIWFYRQDLLAKTTGLIRRERTALNFWKLLVIATIPAGIFGLALDNYTQNLSTPTVVAWALIVGGIILYIVDRKPVTGRLKGRKSEPEIADISLKQAILVGLGQCAAIIPGVSRSGATIVTGLSVGLDRQTATAFSFYLSIPVLVLASGLKLVKNPEALGQISGGPVGLILGIITAFITAFISIAWLLKYVSRHNFKPFAYYRIIIGSLILIFL